jgi:hypothetical protein
MAFAHVHLNARLRPNDRGKRFEDPVQAMLSAEAPGSEVTGGGTTASAEGEPLSCDLDVELAGNLDAALRTLIRALRRSGAPKGSTVRSDDGDPVEIGVSEGVGLYLDGTNVAPEVLANQNVNDLVRHVKSHVGREGALFSFWEGPRETAFYFYGPSAERLVVLLAEAVEGQPLAARHRIVLLSGDATSIRFSD